MKIQAIADIGLKSTTTKRDSLIVARRVLRRLCEQRDEIWAERRALRRQAGKQRTFLPFTKVVIARLEQQASEHRADDLDAINHILVGYGQALFHDSEGYSAAMGFDGLCDALSINAIDREHARREGWCTIRELIVAGLEDGAYYSGCWKDGPLFNAYFAAMDEFIRTCPDHLLPDPFASGAQLGPKPTLRMV
ncbi:hypothetical protein [Azomonas macrocytogenes]|uniref:Uncharacterized protein n=1 Tax=Azomonas macrocytogenes TaxID=69962 RepID=A0A839T5J6_AZOMA|nr:hypothetical protein [Azomonas macrocytogenes]MBB3104358.1 hypothetical protein [Azomonas macrocytogenes]